jgi:hypothetical protein
MSHLTDEQFETLLQGQNLYQDHLNQCEQCRTRLAEKQALAERLRSAFSQVNPSMALGQRIREQLSHPGEPVKPVQGIGIRRRLRLWTASLSAAAAVLVIACILAFSLTPSTAQATQSTLAEIHALNAAAGQHEFWPETDPNDLAARYAERLGFAAQLPCPCETLKLCSCCIKPCLEEDAVLGTYVADTDQGIITVAVLKDAPESLGKDDTLQEGDRRFYQSRFGPCHMVAVRIGDQTYCAVGKMEYSHLKDLLVQLMPADGE